MTNYELKSVLLSDGSEAWNVHCYREEEGGTITEVVINAADFRAAMALIHTLETRAVDFSVSVHY